MSDIEKFSFFLQELCLFLDRLRTKRNIKIVRKIMNKYGKKQ